MTRQERIKAAADLWFDKEELEEADSRSFILGAQWADVNCDCKAAIKKLVEALEFLAKADNWDNRCCGCDPEKMIIKGGERSDSFLAYASEALKAWRRANE
jgi:hypothetical protein